MTEEEIEGYKKAKINGVCAQTYIERLLKGWSPEEAAVKCRCRSKIAWDRFKKMERENEKNEI